VEEWQRRLVDPNWGGGKFGHRGVGGEEILLAALPGMGYRGTLGRLLPRARITPSISQAPGGTVFRGQRFGRGATLNDLMSSYGRPSNAVRPTRGIIRSALKPKPGTLGYSQRADQSLSGVRPYRGPRGIGLYKGRRTGPVNPPVERALNPLQKAAQWWRFNNPWM
jgi:hypothetical protein